MEGKVCVRTLGGGARHLRAQRGQPWRAPPQLGKGRWGQLRPPPRRGSAGLMQHLPSSCWVGWGCSPRWASTPWECGPGPRPAVTRFSRGTRVLPIRQAVEKHSTQLSTMRESAFPLQRPDVSDT